MIDYIKSDLCRYVGKENLGIKALFKNYFFNPGFKFTFWFRIASHSRNPLLVFVAKIQHYRFRRKYMLDIPIGTDIGYGFFIGHGQSVVINPTVKIGNNVNFSQFTSVGANHGKGAVIGDNVYIGPNVCIVEDVNIGSNVKVGAGAVVVKDIPNNVVCAGVPAKVLKTDIDFNDYVNKRW